MFKNFADILAQFTLKQKVFVLILLLITASAIIIIPKYLSETNKDPQELTEIVQSQKITIKEQQHRIWELDSTLISDNSECTSRTLKIQREMNQKLLDQQKYVNDMVDEIKGLLNHREIAPKMMMTLDSTHSDNAIMSIPESNRTDDIIYDMLTSIQIKINKK